MKVSNRVVMLVDNNKLKLINDKLAELKLTLNKYSDNLTLEQYVHLHGDIEELQYIMVELGEDNG